MSIQEGSSGEYCTCKYQSLSLYCSLPSVFTSDRKSSSQISSRSKSGDQVSRQGQTHCTATTFRSIVLIALSIDYIKVAQLNRAQHNCFTLTRRSTSEEAPNPHLRTDQLRPICPAAKKGERIPISHENPGLAQFCLNCVQRLGGSRALSSQFEGDSRRELFFSKSARGESGSLGTVTAGLLSCPVSFS